MLWPYIIIFVYVFSTAFCYNWVRNAYSVGGVFHCKSNNAGIIDFIFTFTPFINTMFAIMMGVSSGNGKEGSGIKLNRVFGIKK